MKKFITISVLSLGLILIAGAGCSKQTGVSGNLDSSQHDIGVKSSVSNVTSNIPILTNNLPEEKHEPNSVYILNYHNATSGVYFVDQNGKTERITPLTLPDEARSFTSAELSPNKKFIFYGSGRGDAYDGFIYKIVTKETYQLSQEVSDVKEAGWLPDGRLQFYNGCIVYGDCKLIQSVDATKPWITKIILNIQ